MSTQLIEDKPTIRILLYTDDPHGITLGVHPDTDLSMMVAHIERRAPLFAQIVPTWMSRNSSDQNHADQRLDTERLKQYDQVWFFGIHQINREKLVAAAGGPENELTDAEITALNAWMRINEQNEGGGGVLVTGDHAEKRPVNSQAGKNELCPDTSDEEFLALGRALGRCVPRAGLLRKWEGPPTARKEDSLNTQTPAARFDIDSLALQVDPLPQQLILRRFDATGKASPDGSPHPLFFYKDGKCIEDFPDHSHEGEVIIPTELDEKVWPTGKMIRPKPQVIAFGTDKRNCRLLNIVAAYNGDSAGVGRIVADSSWHHYINQNLNSFGSSDQEGSTAEQLAQYYVNLAIWLSPQAKRRQMTYLMFGWLARNLSMLNGLNSDVLEIGRTAKTHLFRAGVSPCELHELIHAAIPSNYRELFDTLFLPERGFTFEPLPSKELILGCVVYEYQHENSRLEAAGKETNDLNVAKVIEAGFEKAFNYHFEKISNALQARAIFSTDLNPK